MTQPISYANRQQFEAACGPRLEELGIIRYSSSQQIREATSNVIAKIVAVNHEINKLEEVIHKIKDAGSKPMYTSSVHLEYRRWECEELPNKIKYLSAAFSCFCGIIFGPVNLAISNDYKFAKEATGFLLKSTIAIGVLGIASSYLVNRSQIRELKKDEIEHKKKERLIIPISSTKERLTAKIKQLMSEKNELIEFEKAKNQIELNGKRFKIIVLFSALINKISGLFSGLFSKRRAV